MKHSIKIFIVIFFMLSHESKAGGGKYIQLRGDLSGTYGYYPNIKDVHTKNTDKRLIVYLVIEYLAGQILGEISTEDRENKDNTHKFKGYLMGRYAKVINIPDGSGKYEKFLLEERLWKTGDLEVALDKQQTSEGRLPTIEPTTTDTAYATSYSEVKLYMLPRCDIQRKILITTATLARSEDLGGKFFNDDIEIKQYLEEVSGKQFTKSLTFKDKTDIHLCFESAALLTSDSFTEIPKKEMKLKKTKVVNHIPTLRPKTHKEKKEMKADHNEKVKAYLQTHRATEQIKS